MVSPEIRRQLLDLSTSQLGNALKEYLNDKYSEIGDITKVQTWEETLGKKYALEVLKEIFQFLERKETVEKSRNQYT